MKKRLINQNKTLNLKLRLKQFKGKYHEQDETNIRILLEMMIFSISRLILKYFQKDICHELKII